jgi:prepilin-type N-terminal cleavage/methylation domain-containing protein
MRLIKVKRFFTLLELLVVLLIVACGAALTGVKIKEMYTEQQFLSDSQQVLSQLIMAQDLMLILDTDVTVKIAIDPVSKEWNSFIIVEKPLEDAWAKIIGKKFISSAIRSFQFDNHSENYSSLLFTLGQMSSGTLSLRSETSESQSKGKEFSIYLPGYPSAIGTISTQFETKSEQNQTKINQLLYPTEVYEVLQKNAQNNS